MKAPDFRIRSLTTAITTLLGLAISANSPADETATGSGPQFSAAPFLWMAGMDGDVTVRGRTADVDISFLDVLEDLDLAFMGRFMMETGNWMFQAEPIYMKISDGARGPAGFLEADVESEAFIGKFTAGYAINYEDSRFVPYAGIRYWSMDLELELTSPLGEVKAEKTNDFVDPIVGARFDTRLSGNWRLHLEGDIGGFDTGTEFTWDFTGLLGYDFSPTRTAFAGYRILDVDYENKGPLGADNEMNLQMSGPIIGMHFRF